MKVIYKAPGCDPELRDIPNTLEERDVENKYGWGNAE
jgi:hypothetical protein